KARLRDAYHADAAVVVWNVLEQPFDRVIGVGAFVDIVVALFVRMIRPHLQELTLGHVSPARVFVNEYETLFLEVLRRPERSAIVIDSIGDDAVRRAGQQKRILLR